MRHHRTLPLALCALLLALHAPLLAQAGTPEDSVDHLLRQRIRPDGPGAIVAVVRGGEPVFLRGYGLANLEYGAPIEPATIFHVASVSKQFTAFAIALLESEGRLSLDDDVRRHLPELPDFGTPITLRHLLQHTSGLRDQWTLWALAGGRLDDVIRQADLLALVHRQRELNFPPGTQHLYSNTGYLLLAEVVERVTGRRYGEWLRERVLGPLGMSSTQVYDDHERLVPGRAYSYGVRPEGGYRKAVLSYANQGATSLFTTAPDLARWLGNFRSASVGGPAVIARLQERAVLAGGDTIAYALGVVVDTYRGLRRIQHSGADAGFRSMVVYFPELDAGVITLSNLATFPGGTAMQVAEAWFGERMAPEAAARRPPAAAASGVATLSPELLASYAGEYRGPGLRLSVVREGGQLVAVVSGEGRLVLAPTSDTSFVVPGVAGASLTFHRAADGTVRGARAVRGEAIELERVEPWRPSAAELAEYAGRYYSEELETFYTVVVEEGRLAARHRRHGELALEVAGRDEFRSDVWFFGQLRFERDGGGAIRGFRLSSGRVRNLSFVRVP